MGQQIHDITPNASGGGLVYANHYTALTPLRLSRVLRLASGDQSGTTSSYTISSSSEDFLFAVDNTRFIHFCRNSSGHPAAIVFEVGASSLTTGSTTALRAASGTIIEVKQNPVNPLQFAVTCTDGYTYLVTVGASGTTITTSSHNTPGTVSSFVYDQVGNGLGAIVWSSAGDSFVTVGLNATTGVGVLFTVSGTSLSYVTNTVFTGWTKSSVSRFLCDLTGNATNESMVSLSRTTSGVNFARFTFTTSTLTLSASAHITTGAGNVPYDALGYTTGNIHTYSLGTTPYPTARMNVNGSGSGTAHQAYVTNGMGKEDFYAMCPMGPTAYWGIGDSSTTGGGTVPYLNGIGAAFMGSGSLVTRSSQDPQGFCVSHNYSKALVLLRSAVSPGNYQALGFNVPTS